MLSVQGFLSSQVFAKVGTQVTVENGLAAPEQMCRIKKNTFIIYIYSQTNTNTYLTGHFFFFFLHFPTQTIT